MASTISATAIASLSIVEQYSATDVPGAGGQSISFTKFNGTLSLNAASTPPGTMGFARGYSGDTSLDLTAIVRDLGANLDASGLKLQALLVVNVDDANELTISDGAANAYVLNSGADIVVFPGGRVLMVFNDGLDDVDATHKAIDFTNSTDFQVAMVFG